MSKERELIKKYFAPLSDNKTALQLKNDAACLKLKNKALIISSDMMIEDVHFNKNDPPRVIAKKLLRVNLSDLAAMGSTPIGYILNISIPRLNNYAWLKNFCKGLKEDQSEFKIKLFGGDFCSSDKIFLSVTIFGKKKNKIHNLDSAKEGSDIFVSGTIGDSVMGLKLKNNSNLSDYKQINSKLIEHCVRKHLLPEPKIKLSCELLNFADSCTDISDGLLTDLKKILDYSNKGAEIFLNMIPLSKSMKEIFNSFKNKKKFWSLVLAGGEDYELIFSIPKSKQSKLFDKIKSKFGITKIGRITKEKQLKVYDLNLKSLKLKKIGYSHF